MSFGWSLAPTGLNPTALDSMSANEAKRAATLAVINLAQYVCENPLQAMSVLVGLDWTWDPATTPLTHQEMVDKIWRLADEWQRPSLVYEAPFVAGEAVTYQVLRGSAPVVQSTLYRYEGPRLFLTTKGSYGTKRYLIDLQSGGQVVDQLDHTNSFLSRG